MIILFSSFLSCFLFTYLFSLLPLTSNYFWFLYIFLGIICGCLFLLLELILILFYFRISNYKSRFKHFLAYQFFYTLRVLCNTSVKFYGKENIPDDNFVVFANHKSLMDFIFVYLAYKKIMGAAGKSELHDSFIINLLMRGFNCITIDRNDDKQALKALIKGSKTIKEGYNYMIFPEGGIKDITKETMSEYKAGCYRLAANANCTISPCSIINNSRVARRSSWFKRIKVRVYIHKPIKYDEYKDKNTIDLAQDVLEIVNKGIIDNQDV